MYRTHLKNPISVKDDVIFGCEPPTPSRNSIAITSSGRNSFRSKIPHFASKAIFEMGSNKKGQSLIEILLAGVAGSIMVAAAVLLITPALKGTKQANRIQVASN